MNVMRMFSFYGMHVSLRAALLSDRFSEAGLHCKKSLFSVLYRIQELVS